jgi:hypothetical protein
MKALPKLSEASEQKISSALSKVAALLEDGIEPNDAIVKIASQEKLLAGQVRLMCRAFNTGRSLEHLRTHDTLEEKAASFKLADASEVLERMFPSKVKTASEVYTETAVSTDYSGAPSWLKRRTQSEVKPMEKAASAKAAAYPTYPEREQRQTLSQLNTLRRSNEAAKLDAINSAYAVVSTMDKVAEYFRDPTALPFTVAQHNASLVLGERAKKLMQKVATDKTVLRRFRTEVREKNASLLSKPADWNSAPYTLIKAALDAVDVYTAAAANLNDAEVANGEKRAELLRPFVGSLPARAYTGSVVKEAGIGHDAASMMLANAVADFASKRMEVKPDKEQMVQESLNELGDPAHEDKLRAIRTQAMIHELMAGDPVISGYGYNDVINAHNHLSEVAPKAMQQRVMAQAMLRKYLEQSSSLDPFDTAWMLDVNKSLDERDMPEAMRGYRTGAQRGMGNPIPVQGQSVAPASPEKAPWDSMFGTPSDKKPAPKKPEAPKPAPKPAPTPAP